MKRIIVGVILASLLLVSCGGGQDVPKENSNSQNEETTEVSGETQNETTINTDTVPFDLGGAKYNSSDLGSVYLKDGNNYYPLKDDLYGYSTGVESTLLPEGRVNKMGVMYVEDDGGGRAESNLIDGEPIPMPVLSKDRQLVEVDKTAEKPTVVKLTGDNKYVAPFIIKYDLYSDDTQYFTSSKYSYIVSIDGKSMEDLIDVHALREADKSKPFYGDETENKNYVQMFSKDISKDENLRLISASSLEAEFVYITEKDNVEFMIKDDENSVDTKKVEIKAKENMAYNIPQDIANITDQEIELEYIPTDDGYYQLDTSELTPGMYSYSSEDLPGSYLFVVK